MQNNYLLCGVGGQGTVLASKLIAYLGMKKGMKVLTSETIGMAQRGGCVVSHVRVGDDIFSPLISKNQADMIIAFEPAEAVRCLSYLKKDGVVIVNKKAVKPVTSALSGSNYEADEMLKFLKTAVKNLYIIDGEAICNTLKSPKVLNIALLGAAAKSGLFFATPDEIREAIKERMPEKFHDLNLRAVDEVSL